jgi:hypothetical protein
MSLSTSDALRDGFDRLVSRTGAQLTAVYVAIYLVYQFAFNTLLTPYFADLYASAGIDMPGSAVGPSLGVSQAVAGGLTVLSLVALSWVTVVAIRTFVANNQTAFGEGDLTDGVVAAILNLVAGGLVLMALTYVWFLPVGIAFALDLSVGVIIVVGLFSALLAVVGGAFVFVSFVFMTVYVAAEGENVVAALRHSWGLASGERVDIFVLVLAIVALSFAIGIPVGILQTVVALAAGQAASQAVLVLAIAPASMFNIAAISVAYNQLRGDGDDRSGGVTAPDATAPPA